MERQELEIIILAALLHDIGKFAQRAGAGKSRGMEDIYCPSNAQGRATHLHVLYSDHFIEKDLPLPAELEGQRSILARLASAHHKPALSDLQEKVLSIADRLSAGTDRKEGEESAGDYKTARLLSIFEQISLVKPRSIDELQHGKYYPLAAIEEDPEPVPLEEAQKSDYRSLWEAFLIDLRRLPCEMGVTHYISSLTSLLEKFTWCIPSSTYKSLSDISLYDHAVTTAAIGQALFVFHQEAGGNPGTNATDQKKFLLLGGDLSGIQPYIFGLDKSQGSGVAKLFRARSFYLQALSRSVVNEVLDRLELLPVARIMDAGGRFVLLLPATDRVREFLPDFELEVQRFFFERFQGQPSLNLCWDVELTESDLKHQQFQKQLNRFNDSLENRKFSQFDRLIKTGCTPIIELDYDAYQPHGDCVICHKRPADAVCTEEHLKYYDKALNLCRDCGDQIHLIGRKLPKSAYMVFSREDAHSAIALLPGQWLRLVDKIDRVQDRESLEIVNICQRGEFAHQPIAAHVPQITPEDLSRWQSWGVLQNRDAKTFYGDDALTVGDAKTFSLLALDALEETPDGPIGRSFLGALKADVDNLGLIFSVGLQDRLSISRFACLSRMLNHFFCDYLVRLIAREYSDLYLIFAGGDDLFLLGPWREAVRFANRLREQFAAYVAQRPEFSLSAGIAVVKPHLPVHTIADQAESLLENAKERPGKNSVSLFSTTVGWDDYERLVEQGDWMHRLVQKGSIPMGLLSRLLYYGGERQAFLKGNIKRGIYLSHMAYDFTRNLNENKLADHAERDQLLAVQRDEFLLEHIRLPASYALYRLRKDV